MSKKHDQPAVLIEATIVVMKPEQAGWENFAGIKRDMRPTFFVNGLHYISIVEKCDGVIAPNASGQVTFLMATEAMLETDVTVGSQVELRAGAAVVAIVEILSMKRVFVKSDPSSDRGYVILDEEEERE